MQQFPKKLKIYVILLVIMSAILGLLLFSKYHVMDIKVLVLFSVLSIVVESLLIPLPNGGAVSVGFAISLSSIVIGGPLTAYIVNGIGVLFRFVRDPKRGTEHVFNRPIYKTLFNTSQYTLAAGLSGIMYMVAGGTIGRDNLILDPLSVIVLILTYLVINTLLLSELMSLLTNQCFVKVWTNNIKGMIPSVVSVALLGIIIALAYKSYGVFGVLLFFGPLLLARYSFKLYIDMRKVYMETITALTKAVEAKDPYTSGHASRVGEYAIKLAQELKLPDNRIEKIRTAAILHDIGKIGINDSILNKPGRLTEEEYDKIKEHPLIGAQIVDDIDFLKDVTKIIKYHHERYDGKGYPEGIDGENIPLEAAILSIADVFDAMTSDRPYRKALSTEEALFEIESNSGTQFHPKLANTFVDLVRKDIKKEILAHVN